jgi:hypothetical protein
MYSWELVERRHCTVLQDASIGKGRAAKGKAADLPNPESTFTALSKAYFWNWTPHEPTFIEIEYNNPIINQPFPYSLTALATRSF